MVYSSRLPCLHGTSKFAVTSHVGERPPNLVFEQQLAHSLTGLSRSMQFWDQRQSLSGSSRSRSVPDSTEQELVALPPQEQGEEQQAGDQLGEEQQAVDPQSPLAGEDNSVLLKGSGENNQPGLPGSAYNLEANFGESTVIRGGGGVPEDATSALISQADQPRASGFYSAQSGLINFSYLGVDQSSREITSLSRRFEAAAEGNSYHSTAGYNLNLSFPGSLPSSHRFSPYYYPQRQNQQTYGASASASAYRFDAVAPAAGDPKAQSSTASFGDTPAYGSTGGALSLQQQHQQQHSQFLTGIDQVGSTEMPDLLDPSSWRIQGAGAGGHPETASPTSTSSGEKSERRKRKSEAEETSAKPYACRFCSQSFDKSQALGGHMNRHRQEREREQLDNAQKLVLKQQGLQGLSGLPLQSLSPRAKVQGASQLLSLDQVTLSRFNQVPYQQHPRAFLTGTVHGNPYSTLHASALLSTSGTTWNNLGGYIGGGTASITSGGSMSHLETSGSSNLARIVSGVTPEDIFAASVLQTQPPASPQRGRTADTSDNQADQEVMYGYAGVSTLTSTEPTTSGNETSQSNFHNGTQSYDPQASTLVANMQLYSGVQGHAVQLPQLDIPHNLDDEEG